MQQNVSLSSPSNTPSRNGSAHWRIEDIDFSAIDRRAIEHNQDLFFLLMSASFIETGSDTYAANLAEHYAAWPEIAVWLKDQWESEELQHGRALRAYVETVWPEFPWQQAYDSFFAEYSQLCTMEELYPDPRLEMVARCVVETGTTAYYHTLRELSDEPVLSELLGNVRNDEVNHFKHFLKYFKELQQQSPVGRARIAKALYGRLKELRESDSISRCAMSGRTRAAISPMAARASRTWPSASTSWSAAVCLPTWPCACCSNPCCCRPGSRD